MLSPDEVALVLDRVRINNVVLTRPNTDHCLQLSPGGTIEASSVMVEVVEDRERWVRFDSVVGLNPRKSLVPGLQFTQGFGLIVEKATCLEVVLVQDGLNLLSLSVTEVARVVPLEEVKREGSADVRGEQVASCEATSGDSLEQWGV